LLVADGQTTHLTHHGTTKVKTITANQVTSVGGKNGCRWQNYEQEMSYVSKSAFYL
jgi:hypothetical protein